MSNIDKQRIAAVRTLEVRWHEEFKTIADARCQLRAMQGGYRAGITWRPIEWTGVVIVWSAIAAVVATLALVLT